MSAFLLTGELSMTFKFNNYLVSRVTKVQFFSKFLCIGHTHVDQCICGSLFILCSFLYIFYFKLCLVGYTTFVHLCINMRENRENPPGVTWQRELRTGRTIYSTGVSWYTAAEQLAKMALIGTGRQNQGNLAAVKHKCSVFIIFILSHREF
jgi:hypothetical protein